MRRLQKFGEELIEELEQAWECEHDERERKKLQVIRLVAQHELTAKQIGEAVGVCRASVFEYIKKFTEGGVAGLLAVDYEREGRGSVDAETLEAMQWELYEGNFVRAKDAQRWLAARKIRLALTTVYYWLGKAGGVLKVPRKTHVSKDAAAAEEFRRTLAKKLLKLAKPHRRHYKRVRVWAADEHRYGLLPVTRRCWGLRGERVYAPYRTRYEWGYFHEALELDGKCRGQFLFAPTVRKDVANAFLLQISRLEPDSLHIVVWDGAGFHARDGEEGVPANVRLLPLPPYSPELNPVEGLGDMIKDALANKLHPTLRSLEDALWEEVRAIGARAGGFASMIHDWICPQVNSSGKT